MGIFGKQNVEKLRTSGDATGWRKLLVSPGSSDELVTEAAVALLDLGATDQLRDALLHKCGVDKIGDIADAFVAHGNAKAGPFLWSLWLEEPRKSTSLDDHFRWEREFRFQRLVRDRIRLALVRMPSAWLDDQTTAAVIRVLQDWRGVSFDRTLAAQCLTGVRDPDAVAALVGCLHDQLSVVRLAAAEALNETTDPNVKTALLTLLQDEEPKIRAAVSWAGEDDVVAGLGDQRGLDILIAETENAEWEERARAVASMGKTGAAEALPTLVRMLHDTSFPVKEAAAQSLAELAWEPTMNEDGAYYFLAKNETKQCLRIGGKATEPLMEYLSALDHQFHPMPNWGISIAASLLWGDCNILTLFEVTGEIADRRVVPILQRLLEKEKSIDQGTDIYLKALEGAIASILGRTAPVANPEWIELMDLATQILGETLVVGRKLDGVVTCPSCGGSISVGDAYRPAATGFLVCSSCHDDWLVRFLTGRFERADGAVSPRAPENGEGTSVVAAPDPGSLAEVTPTSVETPPSRPGSDAAWTATFVLGAVHQAVASLPLTEGKVDSAHLPKIRIMVDGLATADFNAAVPRLASAGCVDVAGMDFPPPDPGLRIDTGQLYSSDPADPRFGLVIEGIGDGRLTGGGGCFILTAVDLAIDLVRGLETPLKGDRIRVALRVAPSNVDAVLTAIEEATGRPAGHGFALPSCFAADRTEESRGSPPGSSIEVG